jgi:hypothetical protein
MSWKEPLKERERSLEEEFIHRREEELRKQSREERDRDQDLAALSRTAGLEDADLLGDLLDHGIRSASFVSMNLLPMVLVAWVEKPPNLEQKRAIRQAVEDLGMGEGQPGRLLVEHWLTARPAPRLRELWSRSSAARAASLGTEQRAALCDSMLEPARQIAGAGSGLLGLGFGISRKATSLLEELARAFAAEDTLP